LIFFLLSFYYFNQFQYVNELLLPYMKRCGE
jgi:hypothetical protein